MNIEEILKKSKKIVITTHQSPDGDAIGSSLALFGYLVKKGFDVSVVVPDSFPKFLKWMEGAENVHVYDYEENVVKGLISEADLIFSLDYNDLTRVGGVGHLIEKSTAYKAMIDHHLHPADFADWMCSDTSSCSTAQLIYNFIEDFNDLDLIDDQIAEGIYCGIMTDSGSFRFPSVQAKTHLIAADLINRGLNHSRIHELVHDVNTLPKLHLLGFALNEKLRVLPNVPVAVIAINGEELSRFNYKKGDTEGLVNYALSLEGVEMAAFIKEDDNKVKMSFRSKGDIAVNEFSSQNFSGGGHKNAAGGVSFASFEETVKLFESKIVEFLK
uniref:Phosphoesterase RecJ domain-containing protein n=1 Tax=uncultured Cytophagia bacterium TaxID=768505 RepID=H6RE83_9BACT|nr:exopolyphosphatase [uncultured bacterium]CCF99344.1 phosphoesterase RecJ domain-containing protein [uncultured Cytophagia bacterium]